MQRIIALLSYESPFAPGGGISAVMKYLPAHIKQVSQLPTLVITPFHHNIDRTASMLPAMQLVGQMEILFDDQKHLVDVLLLEKEVTWIFLRPDDTRFFAGSRHPYNVNQDQYENHSHLLRDALFFGAASSKALSIIDRSAHWTLLLQDWEAAAAIFSLQPLKQTYNYEAYLTIHNTYDMPVSNIDLASLNLDPKKFPGETVLQRTIPFVKDPIFTVSEQFASDLLEDPLQTQVMAPHLLEYVSGRLLGVDNGLFTTLGIDPVALSSARRRDYSLLEDWKMSKRRAAFQALQQLSPSPDTPLWGDLEKFKCDDSPWFIVAGRDDPRQKGYDLAYQAIYSFLKEGLEARFLFFPIPGDEGLDGLKFLQTLAEEYPENVIVLPFLFQEGYLAALQGATFGIMPSYYEPFGMANEFYMNGVVGIGRATGGILQQIIPLRSAAAFSAAVKTRTEKYYPPSSHPTGILFRERDNIPSLIPDLKVIASSEHKINESKQDRITYRSTLRLFTEMSRELYIGIKDAVHIYQSDPNQYYQMLIQGIDYLHNTFSWERASQTYLRYIFQDE